MRIQDLYARRAVTYSFEVFPPRSDRGTLKLYSTIIDLKALGPSFISVTFAPDRSNRDRTFQIAAHVKKKLGLESMFHFTCIGATEEQLIRDLDRARELGLENVLALRGDWPQSLPGSQDCGTFHYAYQLVQLIKERYDFGIGVAGHPEGHIESPHKDMDLQHLKEKIEAGGEFVITQIFFDNRHFYGFVERAREIGINVPIIPGILPITSLEQVNRFVDLCGATLPTSLTRELERLGDDEVSVRKLGIDHATRQSLDLLEQGVPGLHFYCLNRPESVKEIFGNLGRRWRPLASREEFSTERVEAETLSNAA
jgi:methylenetetrahydrofolate reductase (NADPH)